MAEPDLAYPSFRLDGRSALVTGASRGIGRALALGLAHAGADVALAARSEDALEEAARKVQAPGRRALVIELDIADVARLPAAVDRALAAPGRLDILVNNAGMEQVADSLAVSTALWDRIPMGRFGRLEDLLGIAAFLCSDAAAYVTGQILYVDGGHLASI
jgi:NAD(P)-dependent dehydrogenase (short-subunit alcohol dehydrogenase family)